MRADNNTIVIVLVTLDTNGRVQSKRQKFTLLNKLDGLFVKDSGNLLLIKEQ